MTDNKKSLITIGIAIVLTIIAGVLGVFIANQRQSNIPAAAAAEANLVCTPFQGLAYFSVEAAGRDYATEGNLTRYRVTATCASQHQVTGIIEISPAAKAASAP